jgi:hypothetical protein
MVEQFPLKEKVDGSNPSRLTSHILGMLKFYMADNITEIAIENGVTSTEKNLSKEFDAASEIGKLVLRVVDERTVKPEFVARGYSTPMLEPGRFPRDSIRNLNPTGEKISEEDVKAAREASVALTIEAAAQVVEARPHTNAVSENSESLKQIQRILNRGEGYIIQINRTYPEAAIKGAREALVRRYTDPGLRGSDKWNDSQVISWAQEAFRRANVRLGGSIDAVEAVYR